MLPIGITCLYNESLGLVQLNMDYIKALEKAGGMPVPVSFTDEDFIPDFLKMVKALLLSGGDDLDPYYYGEEPLPGHGEISPLRDRVEIKMARLALERNMPILGICRGAQVLNVAAGGSIYQDIKLMGRKVLEHMQKAPRHHLFHNISVTENTLLWKILQGKENLRVNSFHHQVIREPGSKFKACAVTSDGVIEGLESVEHPFALGIQWHPEALAAKGIPGGQEIFDAFLQAASDYDREGLLPYI